MIFVNSNAPIKHDYFNVINSIYPKIRDKIDNIFLSFKENLDASKPFVDYFSKGHAEIHSILGDDLSCNSINQLLVDLFLSIIKIEKKSFNYEIPDIFYNFHAVHYFHKIKDTIAILDQNNIQSNDIINKMINFEQNRHKNYECECGENHEHLESNQLRGLFIQLLEYYYSIKKPYSNNLDLLSDFKYLN